MVEVGVTDDDGVCARHVACDRIEVRAQTGEQGSHQRRARYVRIDEQNVPAVLEGEARSPQPLQAHVVRTAAPREGARAPSDVLWTHQSLSCHGMHRKGRRGNGGTM